LLLRHTKKDPETAGAVVGKAARARGRLSDDGSSANRALGDGVAILT
jgi:hypothetical protein